MDAQTIIQIVSTLGFPIVMCAALFWWITKTDENHKEEIKMLSEQQRTDSANTQEALNGLTLAITRLMEKLDNQ